jgi:pyruvate dehydrogenase E2 component (dihydrolipoamide acetyltransferase)
MARLLRKERFGIARKIVSNMTSQSWEEIPHATMSYEPDVTEFLKECKKLNEGVTDKSQKISINTVMMKVNCEGLKAAPKMNCTLNFRRRMVRGTLHYHDNIDISMPMILKSGEMMTVNMHNMQDKTLTEMTAAINDTIRRANNSDMNEVMFEVSLDNTLDGLKKGKIQQTITSFTAPKCPVSIRLKPLAVKQRKSIIQSPLRIGLQSMTLSRARTTISKLGSVYREQKGLCMLLEIIRALTLHLQLTRLKAPSVVKDENGNDKIEVRTIMPITVAIDHRSLDYGDCLPFFRKLDEIFADPTIIQSWK